MTQDRIEIIKYRIEKSRFTLEEAKILFDKEHYNVVFNRAYYACFYSVIALLLCKNLSSSKHHGVLALFNQHFVKTNIIEKVWGEFYQELFDNRQESDYKDFIRFSKEEATECISKTEEFISVISKIVEQELIK